MSLNTIELKDFLLADLYRDSLIDSPGFKANIPAAEPPATDTPATASQTTGEPITTPQPAPASPTPSLTSSPSSPSASTSSASTSSASTSSASTSSASTSSASTSSASTSSASTSSPSAASAVATPSLPPTPASLTSAPPTSPTPSRDPIPSTQNPAARPQSPQTGSAPESPLPSRQPAQSSAYRILGNNRRNVTVIVNSPGIAFLPDDQLAFLGKMLEACKMNMADVAIVNHAANPIRIQELKQQLHPANALLFGVSPVEISLPMDFPVFRIQPWDQCSWLCAPSLGDMLVPGIEATNLKKNLWTSLKSLFGI